MPQQQSLHCYQNQLDLPRTQQSTVITFTHLNTSVILPCPTMVIITHILLIIHHLAETIRLSLAMTHVNTSDPSTLLVLSTHHSTLGDRSFPVAAARAWNALSQHVWNAPSLPVKNWRPFCSGRHSLMRSDNVLCFICTPVVTECLTSDIFSMLLCGVSDCIYLYLV